MGIRSCVCIFFFFRAQFFADLLYSCVAIVKGYADTSKLAVDAQLDSIGSYAFLRGILLFFRFCLFENFDRACVNRGGMSVKKKNRLKLLLASGL